MFWHHLFFLRVTLNSCHLKFVKYQLKIGRKPLTLREESWLCLGLLKDFAKILYHRKHPAKQKIRLCLQLLPQHDGARSLILKHRLKSCMATALGISENQRLGGTGTRMQMQLRSLTFHCSHSLPTPPPPHPLYLDMFTLPSTLNSFTEQQIKLQSNF